MTPCNSICRWRAHDRQFDRARWRLAMNDAPQKGKIIVGVDDDADNLALQSRVVSDAGYMFFGVASGQDCLTLLHRVRPRLVLLDIHMAEMDGFEVCRR